MSKIKGKQIENNTVANANLVDNTITSAKIVETGTISTINAGDVSDGGSASGLARRDHQHAVATSAPSSNLNLGTSNTEGSSANLARADHSHALDVGLVGDIQPTGTSAAAGTSNNIARADHVHTIGAGSVTSASLASSAMQQVLESKFEAGWVRVSSFSANGADDDVTTAVEGAASVTTERNNPTAGKGILSTGTTSGDSAGTAIQNYKIEIRLASTGGPVDDGVGGEVYGVLSKAAGVWTLTYYKYDGTSYSFSGATSIHFMFAEVFSLYTLPVTAQLTDAIFGNDLNVGTHNHNTLYYLKSELNSTTDPVGGSLIGIESADYSNFGTTPNAARNTVEQALQNLNAVLGSGVTPSAHAASHIRSGTDEIDGDLIDIDYAPSNYTRTITSPATHVEHLTAHLSGIDAALLAVSAPVQRQEEFTGESTSGTDVDLTLTLAATPTSAAAVRLFVNGELQRQGTGKDYTVKTPLSDKKLRWLGATASFQLETSDILTVLYS